MSILKEIKKNETGTGYLLERDSGFIDPLNHLNEEAFNSLKSIGNDCVKIKEPLILTCILQKYDVVNANGRIYPEGVIKREWENYKKRIEANCGFGECNHPESSTIDLERIGINIIDGWWEGKTLMGKIEVIMSPGFVNQGIISCKGDIIANLLRKGLRIGVSSRGLGTVKTTMGKTIVQDDFELLCWDAVADPSTPGAYIFYEKDNVNQFVESKTNTKTSLLEKTEKFLNNIEKKSLIM